MATPNITLTGSFENLTGAISGSIIITLKNFGADQPRISGTGLLTDAQISFPVPPGLTFSVKIWGNDQILPGNTYYAIQFFNSAWTLVPTLNYQFTGTGTLDLSSQTPVSVLGVAVATVVAASFTANSLILNGATSGSTTLQAAAVEGGTATLPNNTGTIAELNLVQTWTALQTFSGGVSGTFQISPGPVTLASSATAARTATFPDNTGNIAETNFAQTWSAVQTFSVAPVPSSAGGINLGTAALPWGSIFIGGAAMNNITLTGTATAARTATLPDNTGTLAELNLAQTWSANQTFGATNLLLNPGPITLASAGAAART